MICETYFPVFRHTVCSYWILLRFGTVQVNTSLLGYLTVWCCGDPLLPSVPMNQPGQADRHRLNTHQVLSLELLTSARTSSSIGRIHHRCGGTKWYQYRDNMEYVLQHFGRDLFWSSSVIKVKKGWSKEIKMLLCVVEYGLFFTSCPSMCQEFVRFHGPFWMTSVTPEQSSASICALHKWKYPSGKLLSGAMQYLTAYHETHVTAGNTMLWIEWPPQINTNT